MRFYHDNSSHLIFKVYMSIRSLLSLGVFLVMVAIMSSCNKHVYTGDDLYGPKTSSSRITKAPEPKTKSDDGWATLDIKLSRSDNKALYNEIKTWLGTPYAYAHAEKGKGTDCSGFVLKVYLAVYNKPIERNSARIFEKNCRRISRDELKEGDLVFFRGKSNGISHVGIYLKDGRFAHASSSKGVMISMLSQRYYDTHFYCAGRVK